MLTLTCTFGTVFATREIVITHAGGTPTTTNLGPRTTPVNGLSNVNATYNNTGVQYMVQLITSRTINNLAFVCIGTDFTPKTTSSSTKLLNVKCRKISADQIISIGNVFVLFRWFKTECI